MSNLINRKCYDENEMNDQLAFKLARAKEIIQTALHASMATVNEDGSPHNTPFFLILDEKLEHIYWGSHPEAQHSKNIVRTGQLFVVAYDMFKGGGVYMKCQNGHELSDTELETGLVIFNAKRKKLGVGELEIGYYQNKSPQRFYGAEITNFWIPLSDRDKNGNVLRDYRHEISREELLT